MREVWQRRELAARLMEIGLGLTLPSLLVRRVAAAVPPPPVAPLLIAATNGRVGDTSFTLASARPEVKAMVPHILGFACSSICFSFMNWYAVPGGESVPTSDVAVIKLAVWWVGVGVVPLTFAGSRTPTFSAGAFETLSDELTPASFGSALAAFPRDAVLLVRQMFTGTNIGGTVALGCPARLDGTLPAQSARAVPNTFSKAYATANRIDDIDAIGAMTTPTGSVDAQYLGLPCMVLGRAAAPNPLSVLVIGDSISVGLAEGNNPMKSLAGYGYFDRAAIDPSTGANSIALGHQSRQTELLSQWLANSTLRRRWLSRCTAIVLEHGTNDLASAGAGPATAYDGVNRGSALANLQFNYTAFWALAAAAGVRRIYQTALLPRPSATSDAWASKAGQTVPAGWAAGGLRDQLEAWWAGKVSDGTLAGIIDVRTPVADTSDSHCWLSNGTANAYTSDGIHPVAAGHAAIAPVMRTALLGML